MDATSPPRFVLTVNDQEHPVCLAETTARQAGEMQVLFGVGPGYLAGKVLTQELGPFEVAALMYLAGRQAGGQPDADELLDSVTAGTKCSVTFPDGLGDPVDPADPDADPEG